MYVVLILCALFTLSESSKFYIPANCTLKSSCLCQDEYNNFVDLRPLAFRNGSSRFSDTPTPGSDDGLYSWNPCFGFTEENTENVKDKNCTDVAICKTTRARKSFINLGIQKTAFFSHFDNGNLSLNFYSKENDPNAIQTIISLYCDQEVEAGFRCPGYMGQNVYWLQLRSRYACPRKEADLEYPINFDAMGLKKISRDNTEQPENLSTVSSHSLTDRKEDFLNPAQEDAIFPTENIHNSIELFTKQEHEKQDKKFKKLSTPHVLDMITTQTFKANDILTSSQTASKQPTTQSETGKLKPHEMSRSARFASSPPILNDVTQTVEPHEISTPASMVSTPPVPHVVTMTSKPDGPINTISFLLVSILMIVTLILAVLVAGATYRITNTRTNIAYRRVSNEKSFTI